VGTRLNESDEKDLEEKGVEATLDLVSAVAGTLVHDNSSDHSNTPA
jgi:hypothetical protein